MRYTIRPMLIDDYPDVMALWRQTEGMDLTEDDSREGMALYLRRNEGLCFVAAEGDGVVGTVLCGHDGRRGILRHLAVVRERRGEGIARALVASSLAALQAEGIRRCNLFVLDTNPAGLAFWQRQGWRVLADDYRTLQYVAE